MSSELHLIQSLFNNVSSNTDSLISVVGEGIEFLVFLRTKKVVSSLPILPNWQACWTQSDMKYCEVSAKYSSLADLYALLCYIRQYKQKDLKYIWMQTYVGSDFVYIPIGDPYPLFRISPTNSGVCRIMCYCTATQKTEKFWECPTLLEAKLFAETAMRFLTKPNRHTLIGSKIAIHYPERYSGTKVQALPSFICPNYDEPHYEFNGKEYSLDYYALLAAEYGI